MVMHARFYQLNSKWLTNESGKLVQAIGSDSIVYLPDHLTPAGRHKVCIERAQKLNRKDGLNKGYVGYAIFTGSSLIESTPRYTEIFPTAVEYIEVCRDQKVTI